MWPNTVTVSYSHVKSISLLSQYPNSHLTVFGFLCSLLALLHVYYLWASKKCIIFCAVTNQLSDTLVTHLCVLCCPVTNQLSYTLVTHLCIMCRPVTNQLSYSLVTHLCIMCRPVTNQLSNSLVTHLCIMCRPVPNHLLSTLITGVLRVAQFPSRYQRGCGGQ